MTFPSTRVGSFRSSSPQLTAEHEGKRPRFSSYAKPRIKDASLLVGVLVAGILLLQSDNFRSKILTTGTESNNNNSNNLRSSIAVPVQKQTKPRNVFVDLGANCGNSYLMLRNRTSYFTAPTSSPWDVYLWEANPQLVRLYLNDLAEGKTNHNTGTDRIHVVAAAATTQDTELEFYLTADQEEATTKEEFRNGQCNIFEGANPSGASSLLKESTKVGTPVRVQAFDFGKWLHDLDLRDEDRLLLKIDIEGAELDVLEHMISSYSQDLCRVEQLMVEWHAFVFSDPELKRKHQEFRNSFPERFKLVCGKDVPLEHWH